MNQSQIKQNKVCSISEFTQTLSQSDKVNMLRTSERCAGYNGPIGSLLDLKCIYSSRRFQITKRFVASFHIAEDIAKTPRSGVSELNTAIIILFTVIL